MTTCPACVTYINQPRPALIRALGRWVCATGKPPAIVLQLLVNEHHNRHQK